MPAYYRSSLAEFIAEEPQAVVGQLHIKYEKDGFAEQYLTQTRAWAELVPLLQVDPSWEQIFYGLVLVIAIAAYAALDRARARSLRGT